MSPEHEGRVANGDLAAKEGSIGHSLYTLLSRVSIRHGRQEFMKLRVQLGGETYSKPHRQYKCDGKLVRRGLVESWFQIKKGDPERDCFHNHMKQDGTLHGAVALRAAIERGWAWSTRRMTLSLAWYNRTSSCQPRDG